MSDGRPVLAVVGMTREAKILAGSAVLIGGGDADALAAKLEAELRQGLAGVISFGLCGGLDPALKAGDLVVGEAVADAEALYDADAAWTARIMAALPGAIQGRFARAEAPVASVAAKAALHSATGAAAVDLESWTVARLARWFGRAFAVVRAVSDAASHRPAPRRPGGTRPRRPPGDRQGAGLAARPPLTDRRPDPHRAGCRRRLPRPRTRPAGAGAAAGRGRR